MKFQSSITKVVHELSFDKTTNRKRYKCPECAHKSKRKNPMDLQFYPETTSAYCFKCEATFFEYKAYETKKEYVLPEWKNITELSDKAVKWFTGRLISQKTLNKLKIYSDTQYMPQYQKEVECICFPFFKGDKLINVKYRAPGKQFKLNSGSELIFMNYNAILENDEIYIVEGEIDLLTLFECGIENVVSVPNGANNNLEYLDSAIKDFENIKKIIIATDNDRKGLELRDELARRLGHERCHILNFKQYKDANDYAGGESLSELKKTALNSKPIPIKGAVHVSDFYSDIKSLYEEGLQPGKVTGVDEIDKYISWETGRMCVVTGRPSSGKSEIVDFIISKLNKKYGWKAAYYTPENYPLSFHYAKMFEKFVGKKFKDGKCSDLEFDTAYDYIKDNFKYILDEDDNSLDKILEIAKMYVRSYGIKILVIDPFNVLDHSQKTSETETQYISTFLTKLIKFTRFNDVLTFLIAHPTKLQADQVPTLYNISGSAHFYNKTDYGFSVHRKLDDNFMPGQEVEIYWQKIKFRHLGQNGVSELMFNYNNGRYETKTNAGVNGWDNRNWLTTDDIDVKPNDNDELFDPLDSHPPF